MSLPRLGRLGWALWLVAVPVGCTTPPQRGQTTGCTAAQGAPMLVVELFFGRSIRNRGEVTDRAWEDFVDHLVTPNLPNGYTVFDGTGAWLNPATRHTVHERTKILLVALPDNAADAAAIARIRAAYQARFDQSLVGMTVTPGCGSF